MLAVRYNNTVLLLTLYVFMQFDAFAKSVEKNC